MDILGDFAQLTMICHGILTAQSQRSSSQMLHQARPGKFLKDYSRVFLLDPFVRIMSIYQWM